MRELEAEGRAARKAAEAAEAAEAASTCPAPPPPPLEIGIEYNGQGATYTWIDEFAVVSPQAVGTCAHGYFVRDLCRQCNPLTTTGAKP